MIGAAVGIGHDDEIEVGMAVDRCAPVYSVLLKRKFPPAGAFDELDIDGRSREVIDLWVDAPWFCRDAIVLGDVCNLFIDTESWLSCEVLLGALETFSWRQHFCFMGNDLWRGRDRALVEVCGAFVVSTLSGSSQWKLFVAIARELGMDAFQNRTQDEKVCVERLNALDPSLVASEAAENDVDDGAMCLAKSQLCIDFRYLEKANLQYWSNLTSNERWNRSATGLAVPLQFVKMKNILSTARMVAFAKLPVGWSRIEVPMGFYVELPPVFTYKGSPLRNPRSGCLVVGDTEFLAKTVAFVLFEACNNYRIWRLSRRMIAFMQKLSLKPVLRHDRNVEELTHSLSLKSETYIRQLPQHWGSCSMRHNQSDKLGQRASAVGVISTHARVSRFWSASTEHVAIRHDQFVSWII